jgi:hypothetical protein
MTRFEGYLLIAAISLSFVFDYIRKRDFKIILNLILFLFIGFLFFILAVNAPWTFFKSPISSSYVDEANRRSVGVFDILGFFLHLIFIMGNFFAFYFILFDKSKLFKFIQENFVLIAFLMIELFLAFAWPAAVPRLLIQIIPILTILMVIGLYSFKESKNMPYLFIFPLGVVVYVVGQFLVKSQFLLTNYYFMLVLIFLSLVQIYFIYTIWSKTGHHQF